MLSKIKVVAFLFAIWFWLYAAPAVLSLLIPGSFFLDARSLYVPDHQIGEVPNIEVNRVINRNFFGSWSSTVWEVLPQGSVRALDCRPNSRGSFPYYTHSQLPDPLSLNWWFEIPPNKSCKLSEGDYQIETTWTIKANWLPLVTLEESVVSNVFSVFDCTEDAGDPTIKRERSEFCGQKSER